ncbi:MAG: Barstar (barnase inhibitor) [Candidatus Accumulibacter appositus]|uniref:Barstar (Barnase inhibitor) n=1 Tax=Candidatus Accumulibacter appositus TaxID=1454003 RepID=A0A011NTB1_9PROT|nr:barstar family protein [Accumulibacter sp.]EXI78576.1 MAG: Barstar (barnase inhibitor) [Candidatus Accumulibacter appositus]HRF03563.1 barstar family protein [Accumulibacter sp.]
MTQKNLQALLEDSRQAGVYRLPHGDRRALREAAEAAGFACFDADLGDSDQIQQVLARLGRQLGFPEWYGNNFDALKDCLSDISWREEAGYLLILSRAEALQLADAPAFRTLNQVFAAVIDEWRSQDVPMWVFYDLQADGLATLATLE